MTLSGYNFGRKEVGDPSIEWIKRYDVGEVPIESLGDEQRVVGEASCVKIARNRPLISYIIWSRYDPVQ
jgi:hypothetical protein